VVFDQPGAVTLGCNIHDWMKAYVYVVDTVLGLLIVVQGAASQKHSRRLQCNPVHTAKHRELSVSDR
jgi:hypothetical protein